MKGKTSPLHIPLMIDLSFWSRLFLPRWPSCILDIRCINFGAHFPTQSYPQTCISSCPKYQRFSEEVRVYIEVCVATPFLAIHKLLYLMKMKLDQTNWKNSYRICLSRILINAFTTKNRLLDQIFTQNDICLAVLFKVFVKASQYIGPFLKLCFCTEQFRM